MLVQFLQTVLPFNMPDNFLVESWTCSVGCKECSKWVMGCEGRGSVLYISLFGDTVPLECELHLCPSLFPPLVEQDSRRELKLAVSLPPHQLGPDEILIG